MKKSIKSVIVLAVIMSFGTNAKAGRLENARVGMRVSKLAYDVCAIDMKNTACPEKLRDLFATMCMQGFKRQCGFLPGYEKTIRKCRKFKCTYRKGNARGRKMALDIYLKYKKSYQAEKKLARLLAERAALVSKLKNKKW